MNYVWNTLDVCRATLPVYKTGKVLEVVYSKIWSFDLMDTSWTITIKAAVSPIFRVPLTGKKTYLHP